MSNLLFVQCWLSHNVHIKHQGHTGVHLLTFSTISANQHHLQNWSSLWKEKSHKNPLLKNMNFVFVNF